MDIQARGDQLKECIGYFAFNHTNLPGSQTFFGQLWKEYSFADSRYLTSDPFVLCMETVTAVCSLGGKSAYYAKTLAHRSAGDHFPSPSP